MRWSKEPAHRQTMAAEDRFVVHAVCHDFFFFFLPVCLSTLLHLSHSSLFVIVQAQLRFPAFWRRRFLELKLVQILRRLVACCPSVTVSLVFMG